MVQGLSRVSGFTVRVLGFYWSLGLRVKDCGLVKIPKTIVINIIVFRFKIW